MLVLSSWERTNSANIVCRIETCLAKGGGGGVPRERERGSVKRSNCAEQAKHDSRYMHRRQHRQAR